MKLTKTLQKAAVTAAFSLLAVCLIFGFADHVCNGMFVDWFCRNFTTTIPASYDPGSGFVSERTEICWPALKSFLLWICLILSVLIVLLVFLAAGRCRQRLYRETRKEIEELQNTQHAQEAFLKSEMQRKDDLIAYLAHDLKTPLTSVTGYLSFLSETPDMPPCSGGEYILVTTGVPGDRQTEPCHVQDAVKVYDRIGTAQIY